ncbi:hypothetical protein WOLCODRAFT_149494 [Wolfiporia cocos MD-104 SS10]|uniref:Uncharacterized protein n=1 Tax=Wolfiporia cocos (strain MD-104) TaxID=742152 RepID=A0A2H3JRC3_WOLCO|nr:hypothetical protein WOLCODRAFT_149494 [Wolfiporia cocos MD-104 SS10]
MSCKRQLSRTVTGSVGGGSRRPTPDKVLKLRDLFLERKNVKERNNLRELGLSRQSLNALADIRGEDVPMDIDDSDQLAPAMELGYDDDNGWETLPDDLHANADFMQALRDITHSKYQKRKDDRTWHHRIQNMDKNWRVILPTITDTYIDWQYSERVQARMPDTTPYDFEIETFDIFSMARSAVISRDSDSQSVAVALVINKYLGTMPISPSLAISL